MITFTIVYDDKIKTKKFNNHFLGCVYCIFIAPSALLDLTWFVDTGATDIRYTINKKKHKNR